jgi:hypothetical protein
VSANVSNRNPKRVAAKLLQDKAFLGFGRQVLGNSWTTHRQFLAQLLATHPVITDKPGWVYVYSRLHELKRHGHAKLESQILHKMGLTRRRDPHVRIREQENANGHCYKVVVIIPSQSPAFLERLVHLYFAQQRVSVHKADGSLI